MGCVFKKTTTRPLPSGAEITKRIDKVKVTLPDGTKTTAPKEIREARWRGRGDKLYRGMVTTVDGIDRLVAKSRVFYARYRNKKNQLVEVSTRCRDETAARQVLAELERRAERVRAGVLTDAEDNVTKHLPKPIKEHVDAYLRHLEAEGTSSKHRYEARRRLTRVLTECGFTTLAELDHEKVERWLVQQTNRGMSARTRNTYLGSAQAFTAWCVDKERGARLIHNPLDGLSMANEKADRRRQRRAMTEPELVRLLDVARRRPLLDAMTIRRGKRKGEAVAKVRPETRNELEALGRERALIYKALVITGLRQNELATLTVGQLRLDGRVPYAELDAADEKSREGNAVPIRPDLAVDIRAWLDERLAVIQADARERGEPIPSGLEAGTRLFTVPKELVKILNRDLKLAGIAKADDRGRTIDVHALRTTFGTLLSKGGVTPRTAQAAMRHSDIDLTMNVYTDPRLLDISGALDVLPGLSLNPDRREGREQARATGTDGGAPRKVALDVALPDDPACVVRAPILTLCDSMDASTSIDADQRSHPENHGNGNKKGTLTAHVNVPRSVSLRAGEEIRTPDVQLGKLAFYH
jgi:integrase